jgi:general secretion pathway protein I
MRRRGFTLIEVLVSLAIFALAAVSLGAAYSNVILGRIALQQDEQRLDDIARCRAALMETPGFDDVESGGDIHLPGGRTAHWKGKIEATAVSDLFAVQLTAEIEPSSRGGHRDAHAPAAHVVDPVGPSEDPRRSAPAPRERTRLQGSRRQFRFHQRAHARQEARAGPDRRQR